MSISPYKTNHDNYALFRKYVSEVAMAAFTGAGTSVIPGIPTWKKFLQRLKDELNLDTEIDSLLDKDDVYGAATLLYDASPDSFYEGVAELIKADQRANFNDIHGAIWIAFSKVITTNYDDCFERAMTQRNISFSQKGYGTEQFDVQLLPSLNYTTFNNSQKSLAYIHGKAGNHDLILRREDYKKFYPTCNGGRPPSSMNLEDFLKDIIGEYSLAFIGFSLEDEDFVKTFEYYREQYKEQLKDYPDRLRIFNDRSHFIFLRNDDLKDWINIRDIVDAELSVDKILGSKILKPYEGDPERHVFRLNFENSFDRGGFGADERVKIKKLHEVIQKHNDKLNRLRRLNIRDIRITGSDFKAISDLLTLFMGTNDVQDEISLTSI